MNGRIGVRIGGIGAALACALLVACGGGGGGGGGGGTVPTTPTPTPVNTPTPTPLPSAQANANAPVSGSATTTLGFGSVSSGASITISSGSVGIPPVVSGTNAMATGVMTAAAPTNASAPQVRMARSRNGTALGVQSVAAYFQLSFAPAVSLDHTPSFSVTLPTALSASNHYYLLVLDTTSVLATGWTSLGAATLDSTGTILSFASQPLSPTATLSSGQIYYFALASTGTSPIQTPPPASTIQTGSDAPLPAVTSVPGGRGWLPYQVASALKFPVLHGWNGTGQTIAVVGDATPNPSDVSTYLSDVGLSARPGGPLQTVNIAGGPDGSGSKLGDDAEATLDVETILALAPGATVEFYAMPNLQSSSFWAAEQYVLTDPAHPKVMSISFGGCEGSSDLTDDQYFAQGLALGIAYTASSGDNGNECYNGGTPQYIPGVNNPASDPNVIGVGGNENANAAQNGLPSLTGTAVWNDSYLNGPGASGGGVSAQFTPLPTYQQGVAGVASTSARNVPDIAFPAEGVMLIYQGSVQVYGGTSWSAPIAASLIAELNEYCAGTPTNPVATWYTAFSRSHGAAYVDVVSGNNLYGGTPYYSAGFGYDNASGLGLPIGTEVAANMCPARTWSFGIAPQSMSARASYGERRDTDLGNAINVNRFGDLGQRAGGAATNVTLALRNTPALAQDRQTVLAALQSAGFSARADNTLVYATAPAATVNAFFRTSIHNVNQGNLGVRYANASSMTLPASIAPYVAGALGDNLIMRKRMSHRIR